MTEHFVCPDCGSHVKSDEDGCCTGCGADCSTEICRCDKPDIAALSKRFCELTGGKRNEKVHFHSGCLRRPDGHKSWLCSCGKRFGSPHGMRVHIGQMNKSNPDLTDAREVIRILENDTQLLGRFYHHIAGKILYSSPGYVIEDYTNRFITDTTGLMLAEAVRFLEEK